jgi:hypothetical protein
MYGITYCSVDTVLVIGSGREVTTINGDKHGYYCRSARARSTVYYRSGVYWGRGRESLGIGRRNVA